MIIDTLLNVIQTFVTVVFGILPSLPPMPAGITSVCDYIIGLVQTASYVFSYIYGDVFLAAIVLALIALLSFEQIYHFTMWIIRKLPINVS
jgi:hypothetical protein